MNKIGLGIAVVGIVICLISVGLFVSSGDKFGSLEDSKQYEGRDGEMKLGGYSEGGWLIVTMEGNYTNGRSAIYEEEGTVNLSDEDCNLVRNFNLTNGDGENYFIPTCENSDDTTEDGWIHVGVICDSERRYGDEGKGCPDGTYTWDTNGKLINVWDGAALIEGILGGLAALGYGLLACCCGVVVLLIGIVLAFVLQEEDTSQYYQQNNEVGSTTSGAKGWDEQADYIHKEKEEEDVPEKSEMATSEPEEKKRSGEYELPPPPKL